jgi:hypothetical protein
MLKIKSFFYFSLQEDYVKYQSSQAAEDMYRGSRKIARFEIEFYKLQLVLLLLLTFHTQLSISLYKQLLQLFVVIQTTKGIKSYYI